MSLSDVSKCGAFFFSKPSQVNRRAPISRVVSITAKMRELLASPDYIDDVLAKGAEAAGAISLKTMGEVKELVGFVTPHSLRGLHPVAGDPATNAG